MNQGLSWPPVRWENPEWRKEFEDLYRKAKVYDADTGQPDCELQEKKRELQKIADRYGVKIHFD